MDKVKVKPKYNPETEKFICPYPGCGYECHEPGGVRMHYYWNHTEEGKAKKKKVAPGDKCIHEWEMLDPKDPIELRCIQAGHTKICRRCDEIE